MESRAEAVRASEFRAHFDWIYDPRRVRRILFPTDQMTRAIEQFRTLREAGRIDCSSRSVIVGRNKDVQLTGEPYAYKVDCPSEHYQVVDTMAEARRWLVVRASGQRADAMSSLEGAL